MWSDYVVNNANEFCFAAAVIISVLFYRQYRKYEAEAEKEEMIDNFITDYTDWALITQIEAQITVL